MNDNTMQQAIEPASDDIFGSTESFALAQRVAKGWASSSLVPEAYMGNVPNVLIAMEIASRIGASIMGVMQHLYIVHGKPSFEATFLIATVNGSGRFTPIRYRFEGKAGTDAWGCRAYAGDKETGEECLGPLVNLKMAKDEGWFSKKGSKWQTMPELMLHYRAAAFWTRVFSPELSMGIHTRDEMSDIPETIIAGPSEVVRPLDALTEKLKSSSTDVEGKPQYKAEAVEPKEALPEQPNTGGVTDTDFAKIESLCVRIWGNDNADAFNFECKKHGIDGEKMTDQNVEAMLGKLEELAKKAGTK